MTAAAFRRTCPVPAASTNADEVRQRRTLGAIDGGAVPVYGFHGLRVRSAVPLAGFDLADEDCDFDLRWRRGQPVPADPPSGRLIVARTVEGSPIYLGTDDGTRLRLRVPGVCDFVIDPSGQTVDVLLDPFADERLVAVLVTGLLVGFLLSVGGSCVLHASAVEVDGQAVAFAGPSGAGKSTLAALLCAQGARLVTDDVLRVVVSPRPECVGGGPELRLRPGGAWSVGEFRTAPPLRTTVDSRLAVAPTPVAGRVPLAVVVLLRVSGTAASPALETVAGAPALVRLLAANRIVGWTDPSIVVQQFRATAHVAARVAVIEATIPWGVRLAPSIAADLLAHGADRR